MNQERKQFPFAPHHFESIREASPERTPLMNSIRTDNASERSVRSAYSDVSVYSVDYARPASSRASMRTVKPNPFDTPQLDEDAIPIRSRTFPEVEPLFFRSDVPPKSSEIPDKSHNFPRSPEFSYPHSDSTLVGSELGSPSQSGSGGYRGRYYDRGVLGRVQGKAAQDRWPEEIQKILRPCPISRIELYEEALESPKSGVAFTTYPLIGEPRDTSKGNERLAIVGEQAMKLILTDQCYLFKYNTRELIS